MIKKKEFYKWERIHLVDGKTYPHISFVTAYYFMGLPVYKYEKYVPNKVDQFDIDEDERGFVETKPRKKTGTYDPSRDEGRKLEGQVDGSFD